MNVDEVVEKVNETLGGQAVLLAQEMDETSRDSVYNAMLKVLEASKLGYADKLDILYELLEEHTLR